MIYLTMAEFLKEQKKWEARKWKAYSVKGKTGYFCKPKITETTLCICRLI